MRVLGIDYGTKRIGLAVADTEAASLAVPRGDLPRNGALAVLAAFCRQERIGHIIIGLPMTLRGEEGDMAQTVRSFGKALTEAAGVPVDFVDERLTTAALPKEGVVSRDAASAASILQTWLDRQRGKP